MSARLLIELCGLSHREAADLLSVRLDTVKSWHRAAPSEARSGIISDLKALHRAQRAAAAQQIRLIRSLARDHGQPEVVQLSLSADDHEARSKGWPCVGAERMTYAMVAARLDITFVLVPRGATLASAAAGNSAGQ